MSDTIPTDDDIYLNTGEEYVETTYYPTEPQERIEDEQHEAAILAASYPIMTDVTAWFDEQIEATDSRRAIIAWAKSHDYDIDRVALAFDIVRELLEEKSKEFARFRPSK